MFASYFNGDILHRVSQIMFKVLEYSGFNLGEFRNFEVQNQHEFSFEENNLRRYGLVCLKFPQKKFI